jgi:vacuolar protein sorting-associated protein 11
MKTDTPHLLRSTKLSHTTRPHPVSTVALSAALSYLAVSLADGTVLLYRHLDQSIFSGSTTLTALPKPRIIYESPTEPVTGLGFKEPTEENPNVYLFIVTINNVSTYQASGRGSSTPTVIDQLGCGLGSAALDWRAREMVVAREEAIYIYNTEGRGACYAYEGEPRVKADLSLLTKRDQIQVTSRPSTRISTIWSLSLPLFRRHIPPHLPLSAIMLRNPANLLVRISLK